MSAPTIEARLSNKKSNSNYLVMDNKYVLTGFSAGELTSKENLIILEGKDIVDSYVKNFESLWEEFKDNSVDI